MGCLLLLLYRLENLHENKTIYQQRQWCACVPAMRNERFVCDVVLPHRRTSCKINELLTNFNNIIIIIQRNQTITNKFYIYTRLSTVGWSKQRCEMQKVRSARSECAGDEYGLYRFIIESVLTVPKLLNNRSMHKMPI